MSTFSKALKLKLRRSPARARARRSRVGRPWAADAAVFHHDDEGLGFALGDQVVHDQAGVALAAPAGFIFAPAVLQIEHRIALARVLVVAGRRVNEDVARLCRWTSRSNRLRAVARAARS